MKLKTQVLFGNALDMTLEKIKNAGVDFIDKIILVRDFRGRIRIMLRNNDYSDVEQKVLDRLKNKLSIGPYCFPISDTFIYADDLMQGNNFFNANDLRLLDDTGKLKIYLLERQITCQDWMLTPFKRRTKNRRVTFFGIKGGVGRSTALIIWAWWLASKGKKILIFDFDLESPGVSSTLLPNEKMPDYGIVDWFVEDAIGQADIIENAIIASSPLAENLSGEIKIVPAFGQKTGDYIPKLARCYTDIGGNEPKTWAQRVHNLVEQMEIKEKPDIVIMDSRAGIHDIAAVTITRMDADTFLFAVDSAQTWNAYSFLFEHWRQHPNINQFRHNLQIVASQIPETERDKYLNRFKENSWNLFQDHIYDKIDTETLDPKTLTSETFDAFNFNLDDEDAPHYPLKIYWHRALQEFNPLNDRSVINSQIIEAAMGSFIVEAETMVFKQEIYE